MRVTGSLVVGWLCLAALMAGCGGDSSSSSTPVGPPPPASLAAATVTGRVHAPAGLALDELVVANSLGSGQVGADGRYSVPAWTAGPQFTVATGPDGQPRLLAFADPANPVLDPRTTADALVWFGAACFLLEFEDQEQLLVALADASELAPLEQAITQALAAGTPSPLTSEGVQSALETVCAQLQGRPRGRPASLLIRPAEGLSGITLLQGEGLNTLRVQNAARRRTYVYVDRVSYQPEGGGEYIPSPARVRDFDGPMAIGVGGTVSTFVDFFRGRTAYAPKESSGIPLPLYPEGARRTRYRVAVVGTGLWRGALDDLNDEEAAKARWINYYGVVSDFLGPMLLNLALPLKKDEMNAFLNSDAGAGLFKDCTNLFLKSPGWAGKVDAGDLQGAANDIKQAILTSGSVRKQVLDGLAALIDANNGAKAGEIAGNTGSALNACLTITDAILVGFDTAVQGWHVGSANKADVWYVEAIRPRIVLTPPTSEVKVFERVLLEAKFPEAESLDAGATYVYAFTRTGPAGVIFNAEHQNGPDTFETSSNWVHYVAEKGVEGTDTVTVEAFEVRGDDRVSLGTSSATVKVTKDQFSVTLAPRDPRVRPGGSVEVTAQITPAIADRMASYILHWSCTGKRGDLSATNDYLSSVDHTRYTAGQSEGTDDIFFEVIHVMGDQRVVEGRAMATVTVRSEGVTLSASNASPAVGEAVELVAGYPAAPGETILYAFACAQAESPAGQLITDAYSGAQAWESRTSEIGYWPRRAGATSVQVEVFSISGAGRTSRGTARATLDVQALTVPVRFQEWQIYDPGVGGQYYVCESYFAFPGPLRASTASGKPQVVALDATFSVDFHGNASRPAIWEDGVLVTLGLNGWMGSTPSPVLPTELYQPVQADAAENPDRRPLSAGEWASAKAAARQRCEDACRGWTATLEAIGIAEW